MEIAPDLSYHQIPEGYEFEKEFKKLISLWTVKFRLSGFPGKLTYPLWPNDILTWLKAPHLLIISPNSMTAWIQSTEISKIQTSTSNCKFKTLRLLGVWGNLHTLSCFITCWHGSRPIISPNSMTGDSIVEFAFTQNFNYQVSGEI